MAFGSLSDGDDETGELAEINMIPLIDVMLVLLVIFIVTAPLLTHAVKVELPQASSTPNLTPPANVQLAIDADARRRAPACRGSASSPNRGADRTARPRKIKESVRCMPKALAAENHSHVE